MRAIRWILGWSVGLAVPAGVFVFAAGPEEAAQVARDALEGVRGAASEAWSGLSTEERTAERSAGEYGFAEGRLLGPGVVCDWNERTVKVVDEAKFLSALNARVRGHMRVKGSLAEGQPDFVASIPPSLALGDEESIEVEWPRPGTDKAVRGNVRFSMAWPCNHISVREVEVR